MAAERATITLTMALFGVVFALHLQAQGVAAGAREAATAAVGDQAGAAAEFVLLEPKLEQLPAAAVDALNATSSKPVCGRCRCCLSKTNPQVCLTTCCFQRTCAKSVCWLPAVSCGCNGCDYPAGKE